MTPLNGHAELQRNSGKQNEINLKNDRVMLEDDADAPKLRIYQDRELIIYSLDVLVEFYLSDSNLPFDKFLFGIWSHTFHTPSPIVLATPVPADYPTSALSSSKQSSHDAFHLGWLPLERLTSFKRMAPYLEDAPTGLGSIDAIAAVLVADAKLVEVRQFGTEGEGAGWYVRRTTELCRPEDALGRSLYIKGFPVSTVEAVTDEERSNEKLGEDELQKKLEAWVRALDVGAVQSLRLRRETAANGADGKIPKGKGRGKFKVPLSPFLFPFR
jgi:lupus La protein